MNLLLIIVVTLLILFILPNKEAFADYASFHPQSNGQSHPRGTWGDNSQIHQGSYSFPRRKWFEKTQERLNPYCATKKKHIYDDCIWKDWKHGLGENYKLQSKRGMIKHKN